MSLNTSNATSQAKLLLGHENVVRIEPQSTQSIVDLSDYDGAVQTLPAAAAIDFEKNRARLKPLFSTSVHPRQRFFSQRGE
jgi:hypothetical protein